MQSGSDLVEKLGLLSEWHSSLYNKASIKQKSNKEKKFPHHPPHPLPHLCFSPPNPPFPSLVEITLLEPLSFCKTWSDGKIIIHAKKTKWKLLYNRIPIFQTTLAAWESKFVPVIGIWKIGGKQCLAGEGKLGLLQNMGNFKTPRARGS